MFDAVFFVSLFDLVGVAAFAATGALVASRNRLDILGAIVLGFITGVGGGTLRDVLLDTPVFWLNNNASLVACGAGVAAVYAALVKYKRAPEATIDILDAAGLALFTVIGAYKAIILGHGFVVAVITGFLTGCGGGILRDVLANEVPLVLAHKRLYATPSLAGGLAFALLYSIAEWMLVPAAIIGCAMTFGVRIASIQYNWRLPLFPDMKA
jgi:uncharacterized membrane protein YeiH